MQSNLNFCDLLISQYEFHFWVAGVEICLLGWLDVLDAVPVAKSVFFAIFIQLNTFVETIILWEIGEKK